MGHERDLNYGKDLLEVFRAFVEHMIASGLKKTTIRNHMHHLWLLGGHLIRDVSLYDEYSTPALKKLKDSVYLDGGPLCRYLSTETELRAFDSTCRKLHKFLEANT